MNNQVNIPDQESLDKKLAEFKRDGAQGLHVIADFDRTLTKGRVNGEQSCVFDLLKKELPFSAECQKEYQALYDEYYPQEISPFVPVEEKKLLMDEWWSKYLQLTVEYGLNLEMIENLIRKNKIQLRDGAFDVLNLLAKKNVPLLIFSSGIVTIIQKYLESERKLTNNIHIIANFLEFDNNGNATGYKTPLIHTFNKNEVQIKHVPYLNQIRKRKNVLLLGDMLGDVDMAKGIDHDCCIHVGFLNQDVDQYLEQYAKVYDVLVLNDGPMDYTNFLLNSIFTPQTL